MKKNILLFSILISSIASIAQVDRYWSGGSPSNDQIDQGSNWFGGTNPSSGDNLYFNNTLNRHWAKSNYGGGSFFRFFITYNGAGGIKLYGDNTYAYKFENNNDANLLELSPDNAAPGNREIGNRINNDLEINPVGSGGVLVSCDKISMDNINGARNLKVYGTNTLTINGNIYEKNGTGATLQILGAATVELKGNSTFTGTTTINAGILKLNASGGALNSGNTVNINGGTLRVMQSQTLGNLTLSSGTLTIDPGVTLTITGTYSATGGSINNFGTIKLSGGSVSFPGTGITLFNGANGTLTNLEIASSGTVTLNSGFVISGALTLTSGTLALASNNLSIQGAVNRTAGNINATTGGINIFNSSNLSIPASTFMSNSIAAMSIIPGAAITVDFNDDISIGGFYLDPNGTLIIGSHTLSLPIGGTLSGYLTGSSNSNLIIGGAVATLNFTQTSASTRSLNNLTLNTGASATLATALDVYGTITLTTATLNLNTQNLTLKSNSSGTARIADLTGSSITNATNVTVERWIPQRGGSPTGGRAYRLLAPTVNTSGSIKANWMETGMNTAIGTNINPVANYGTQITGSGGNSNGFDVTQTNASSLYATTNAVTPTYTAIGNTSGSLNALTGYFLYIRGDRSVSMQVPLGTNMPTTSTTLRTTGTLVTGTQTAFTNAFVGGGALNLVTNPYPSPIDWSLVQPACINVANAYTLWDPNVGTRGGFVTVTTAGVVSGGGTATKFIQPGQAFFVQASGGVPAVSIQENHKAAGNNNTVFLVPPESFQTSLYFTEDSGYRRIADGVNVLYDNVYSFAHDAYDAAEINNWDENIAIDRDSKHLAIESRPVITTRDTIPLFMNNMKQRTYEFEFTPSSFTHIGLKAELVDNFLNTRTLLSVVDTARVPFAVTANPASAAANRFMVVFGPQSPLAIDVLTIKAQAKNNGVQVDWTAKTEKDMDRYELERSNDGTVFNIISTTIAIGNSQAAVPYSWLDNNPKTGNNFYRIKAIDKSGAIKYTDVVKVAFVKTGPSISVSPNPVSGNSISLQLNNIERGSYYVSIINNLGQVVYTTQLQHAGGSAIIPVTTPGSLARGPYELVLTGEHVRISNRLIKN